MCANCWIAAGQPVAWDETVAELTQLIRDLYEVAPTGGPLHVELDDWNLDADTIVPMYEIPPHGHAPGHPDRYSRRVHELCDRIAELMTPLPQGWRESALAHSEGLAVQGQIADGYQQWGRGSAPIVAGASPDKLWRYSCTECDAAGEFPNATSRNRAAYRHQQHASHKITTSSV